MYFDDRDDDDARKGTVIVVYHLGKLKVGDFHRKSIYVGSRSLSDLPIRPNALHHCMNDRRSRLIVSFALTFFDREHRARAKIHMGTLAIQVVDSFR